MSGVDFALRLAEWAYRTAIIGPTGETCSYLELARRADLFAADLGNASLLAIEAERDIETVVAYVAALREGIPVLMFEGGVKSERLLSTFTPDLIYARTAEGRALIAGGGDGSPAHPNLSLLLSTSGSTGSPKLVRLSGVNIQSNAESIVEYLGIRTDQIALASLPLFYSYGLSVLNSHLQAGACTLLTDLAVSDPAFAALAITHQATSLAGVPTTYDLLISSGVLGKLPQSLRTFTQAGGKMKADRVREVASLLSTRGASLCVMYGQTEASPRMAYLPPDRITDRADCIGRAIPGGTLSVEVEGKPVEPGATGELVYRGPNVMMGYALARSDLAKSAELAELRTGDLAAEVEPGLFRIEGRLSRFIKPLGLRVGLDELENIAAAAGVTVHVAGSDDGGVVVAATNDAELEVARKAIAILNLPDSLISFERFDGIPQLGSGKIDYSTILRRRQAQRLPEIHAGVDGIAACFARAARGRPISPVTTFSEIAGDSLSFIETSIAMENAIGALPADWTELSLRELQGLVTERMGDDAPAARRGGALTPEILVRAIAITAVVINHAVNGLQGGADVMMVLAGLSWARYQRPRIAVDGAVRTLWRSLHRILAIYYAIVILYSVLKHQVFYARFLMFSTFRGDWDGSLNIYWFIESLFWCTIAATIAWKLLPARHTKQAREAFAVGLMGAALVIRFAGAHLLDAPSHAMRSPDQMMIYFAAGVILADLGIWARIVAALLTTALSMMAWGTHNTHWIIMALCLILIVGNVTVLIPRMLRGAVMTVAQASFYIYVLSVVPMYLTDQILHAEHGKYWAVQIILAVALGITASRGTSWLEQSWNRFRGDRSPDVSKSRASGTV